jgi:hypothetical protein
LLSRHTQYAGCCWLGNATLFDKIRCRSGRRPHHHRKPGLLPERACFSCVPILRLFSVFRAFIYAGCGVLGGKKGILTMKWLGWGALSVVFALLGLMSGASAQQSAGVICNSKSALTNIRTGPTAKGTSVVEAVPSNTRVAIQERVRNPEGTHEWLRVSFRSPNGGGDKQGFVFNEMVAPTCSEQAELPQSTPVKLSGPSTITNPLSGVDISRDPTGSGSCNGYTVPFSLMKKNGILLEDIKPVDVESVECGAAKSFGYYSEGSDPIVLFKILRSGIDKKWKKQCYIIIRLHGKNTNNKNYVSGKVEVEQKSENCEELKRPTIVQNDESSNGGVYTVYFTDNFVFKNYAGYQANLRKLDELERQKNNRVEENFAERMRSQDGAQGLYLLAGRLERENENSRAQQVYKYIISEHPKSDWAVKANDRLLAMRGETDASRRALDTQNELAKSRDQAAQMCRNRRSACFSSCSNLRTVGERNVCEGGCGLCN